MKIAILGSGNIAETHAQALTESSGYQLRGVYSPSQVWIRQSLLTNIR